MHEAYLKNDSIIQVRNLTKKFKDFTAVDDVSFDVRRGEIFAFLGPNGAGKTTTIKMLTTLLQPTSGEMLLDGFDPAREQNEVRRSFGIVFQDPSLDDELTTYENMYFHAVLYKIPKSTRKARIEEMLKFVQLWGRRDDQVKFFSGGMKRRLEIARGLLHLPKILFLDEPTLGLDPQTRNLIWEHIKDLNKKEHITVFLTTHIMEEADRVADKVAIIDHGKIVAQGTPRELKERTGSATLEEAFLTYTGKTIREEEATGLDNMRMASKMWTRKARR
ncbi:MAG: ATP-binding cassette domain-containing protein [Actinomycetota bacterium]|nr:ATP-binding cassette domain-containing protein [Actinomycetota bacterium]